MTQARAVLAGTGISIPPLEVDNHMLSRIIDTKTGLQTATMS